MMLCFGAAYVCPLMFASPAGTLTQAHANPKPGDPGGNHSKPGDKKKKKDDNQDNKRSDSDPKAQQQRSSGGRDETVEDSTSGSKQGTDANNRWISDGDNRSVDVRVTRSQSPTQQQSAAQQAPEPEPISPADPTTTASPPTPPTTTDPPGTQAGRRILQLGADTAKVQQLVDKAQPLQQQLDQLQNAGWTIRYSQPGDEPGTFTKYEKQTIVIDENSHQGRADLLTRAVAHEVGHALYGPRFDQSSREAYVNSGLANEGAATLNAIKMQRWIASQGGPDIGVGSAQADKYNRIYDTYVYAEGDYAKATAAIGKVFGDLEHPSSAPLQTYAQFYGEWYDLHVATK